MTMDLVIFVTATVVAFLLASQFWVLSQLDELKENWIQQRCNPIQMPFAGMVGVSVAGNFTRCTMKSFQDQAGFILDPINQLFGTFLSMFKSIADSLQSLRNAIKGIRDGFLGIVSTIFGKLANTMSQMHQLMTRIRTVFMRLVGVFAILVNVMNTGIASGKSVMNGPIGKTIGFFDSLCFDANQLVTLHCGRRVSMRDVRVGDVLENGARVNAIYVFSGDGVPLQDLMGVKVTGSHLLADGTAVENHPDARRVESVDHLACLDTSTHTIPINNVVFQDFGWADWEDTRRSSYRLGSTVQGIIVGFRFSEGTGWEVLAVDK